MSNLEEDKCITFPENRDEWKMTEWGVKGEIHTVGTMHLCATFFNQKRL